MKNMKKKSVKGMTLVEIIIALVVFSIAALLMAQIATVSTTLTRNSNHVTRKTSLQAPVAENANITSGLVQEEDSNLKVVVKVGSNTVNIAGKSYTTSNAVGSDRFAQIDNGDLEFVKYDTSKTKGDGLWVDDSASS